MSDGIFAAASAMVAETRALEVVAANIANLRSAGYRRGEHVRSSFAELLERRQAGPEPGQKTMGVAAEDSSYRVFRTGEVVPTGGPLDVALDGPDAFFRIEHPNGQQVLTRAGHFALDDQGQLVTPEGWPVLGQAGLIVIPPEASQIEIDGGGRIYARIPDDEGGTAAFVEQLRVVEVPAEQRQRLVAISGQHFEAGEMVLADAVTPSVRQGFVEGSNVDAVSELARMISLHRRHDAAQRALKEQMDRQGNYSEILSGS